MQNKTDKETSLVSKSLPVANSNYVNRLFSERKKNCMSRTVEGEVLAYACMLGDTLQALVNG